MNIIETKELPIQFEALVLEAIGDGHPFLAWIFS